MTLDPKTLALVAKAQGPGPDDEDPRPTIEITQELGRVTDAAIGAIAAGDLGVYVRGRRLVCVARDGSPPERWLERWPGSPVIVQLTQARVAHVMDAAARWVRFTAKGKWSPQRPPEWAAKDILERMEWPLPYLEAVIEAPTIRADGSILNAPGWDAATGLLYDPLPGVNGWPTIPEGPTAEEVAASVKVLTEPFSEFPFVGASDRGAAIAAVLSLLARHLISGPVPMFVIRAPTPGTGKTLLADTIGLIATGRELPAMAHTYDSEELRKRITSLAVEGTKAVLLDNISGSLGSDILASALTKSEWEDRMLGSTATVRVPLQAVWLATGNNVGFKRTLSRRVIPCDMDAGVEVPEDREGPKDGQTWVHENLLAYVKAERPKLATAALTVLRAFILAGRPSHGAPRMGSFESWDDLVRSCVIWAGLGDPASTDPGKARARVRSEADDDTENLGLLLAELQATFPIEIEFQASEAIAKAEDTKSLLTAIAGCVSAKAGKPTARHLGYAFRSYRDRPVGGLVLRRSGQTKKGVFWMIEDA